MKIANNKLIKISEILSKVKTKGVKGRAVARFSASCTSAISEYVEAQQQIIDDYKGSVEGNIVTWSPKNGEEANNQLSILNAEIVKINLDNVETIIQDLIDALLNDVDNLTGDELQIYDLLLTELEKEVD